MPNGISYCLLQSGFVVLPTSDVITAVMKKVRVNLQIDPERRIGGKYISEKIRIWETPDERF